MVVGGGHHLISWADENRDGGLIELEMKVNPKVRNHGEGPY